MGTGYMLRCRKCGFDIKANLGVGFSFPKVYQRTIEDARAGEYGQTIQRFLQEYPDGALDVETVFLQCANCGTLKCGPDLSMYIRNSDVPRKEHGIWSVAAPFVDVDYVSPMELKRENTYILYAPGHICEKCGKPMKSISQNEITKTKSESGATSGQTEIVCPGCRELLWIEGISMWD